jgi:hypothetical protein
MFRKVLLIGLVLGIITIVASAILERDYRGKSKMIQRVQKSTSGELFGDGPTMIGSPMPMIIEDQAAFVGEPQNGIYQVDEDYLKAKNIYPRQLKTVEFVLGNIRLAAFLSSLLCGAILFFRNKKRHQPQN